MTLANKVNHYFKIYKENNLFRENRFGRNKAKIENMSKIMFRN